MRIHSILSQSLFKLLRSEPSPRFSEAVENRPLQADGPNMGKRINDGGKDGGTWGRRFLPSSWVPREAIPSFNGYTTRQNPSLQSFGMYRHLKVSPLHRVLHSSRLEFLARRSSTVWSQRTDLDCPQHGRYPKNDTPIFLNYG
ncbi:hypothetical protein GE061_017451 [Apolygus lucorum]|uniref:Uncharacterized protein n=1 Tax=Apolygus lucorum TaxID=248454 RepID=A0A6A4JFP9_APOLU|nr:hypothetical protein GE061_017451 [Apolygus lucorum]